MLYKWNKPKINASKQLICNLNVYTITFLNKTNYLIQTQIKLKQFNIIILKTKLIKNFFLKLTTLITQVNNSSENFLLLTKYNFLNIFWKINIFDIFLRIKDKKKALKVITFFLKKNNIKLLILVNINNFTFLKILQSLHILKVGISQNPSEMYYHYFLHLPMIDYYRVYTIYHFSKKHYILSLNKRYQTYRFIYFNKMAKLLEN